MISSVAKVNNSEVFLHQCNFCHQKIDLIKRCSRCRSAIYCNIECQKNDWKDHRVVCKPPIDTTTPYTEENKSIRKHFTDFETYVLTSVNLSKSLEYLKNEKYNHVLKTQEAILRGSSHLDPDSSVVVVCGAQFYGEKFVEPLPQLLEKCKELILLDVDPATLEKLHSMLGSSDKVSKVVLDFTFALKDLPAFWKDSSESTQQEFISNISDFMEIVTKNTEKRAAGLPGVLSATRSADYVISSLVASQLTIRLKEDLFSLFSKKFNCHITSVMTPQLTEKIADVLLQNMHTLMLKHTQDLCALAGQKGRVYFADSYKNNSIKLIADETLKDLAEILEKRKGTNELIEDEWYWAANPQFIYDVKSILS